jgi:hypothetical protein
MRKLVPKAGQRLLVGKLHDVPKPIPLVAPSPLLINNNGDKPLFQAVVEIESDRIELQD